MEDRVGHFIGHRKLVEEPHPVGEKGPEEIFTKHKVCVGFSTTHCTR